MAASIANDNSTFSPMDLTEKIPSGYYKIAKQWDDISVKDKVPFVQKINDMIFDLDEKVIKVNGLKQREIIIYHYLLHLLPIVLLLQHRVLVLVWSPIIRLTT
jgi:hypothetical protein